MIESRKVLRCLGLPVRSKGDSTATHKVRRPRSGAQATCVEADRGLRAGQRHSGVNCEAGRAATLSGVSAGFGRHRLINVQAQSRRFPQALRAKPGEAAREPVCEGNRSRRGVWGSRSGFIVAIESRVTNRRKPVSSEGNHRGEGAARGGDVGEFQPQYASPITTGVTPPRANPTLRRTGCVNCARPGLWGSRRATAGTTRQK